MSDRLQQLAVFVRVAESGSFSQTGRELGLSQSSVSRILTELETRVGVKLLLRTTRRVVPTEAGLALLPRAHDILERIDEAEGTLRNEANLIGTLRIALPSAFGSGVVIPALPSFIKAHPALRIELRSSDAMQDLVAEGIDIAIRFGPLPDSTFGTRRLARTRRLAVAAPAYLAARSVPIRPDDLAGHDCIFGPGLSARSHWRFSAASADLGDRLKPRVQVASAEGVVACARVGLGIGVGSEWLCRPDLDAGKLVSVLDKFPLEPTDLYAVYPAGRHPSRKVRAFADHLAAILA